MKKLLTVLMLVSFGLMIILAGCSDDDDVTGLSGDEVEGFQELTSLMVYGLYSSVGDGIDYVGEQTQLGKTAKPADSTYSSYDAQTGWWYFYYEDSDVYSGDSISYSLDEAASDSLRMFDTGGDFQHYPDTDTDSLQFISQAEVVLTMTTTSESYSLEIEYYTDADYGGLTGDTISIDGDYDYNIYITENGDDFIYEYESEYDQVLFELPANFDITFPHSGTVTIDMYIEDTASDESLSAAITLTFSSTGYHGVMIIDGNTYTWDATWEEVEQVGQAYLGDV